MGFLSSGDGDFREPQGCQASFLVVRGTLGFLSTHCRRIRPHLKLKRETHVFSPFVTGISGFLLSFNRGLRPRLLFRHGNLLSAQVAKGVSGLLLVESGNLAFNRGTIGESDPSDTSLYVKAQNLNTSKGTLLRLNCSLEERGEGSSHVKGPPSHLGGEMR